MPIVSVQPVQAQTIIEAPQTPGIDRGALIAPITSEPMQKESEPLLAADFVDIYAKKYNVSVKEMDAISYCESTNRQFDESGAVLRGIVDKDDVGLYQINTRYHFKQSIALNIDIFSLEGNIHYAAWLLSKEGMVPWNASKDCWRNLLKNGHYDKVF